LPNHLALLERLGSHERERKAWHRKQHRHTVVSAGEPLEQVEPLPRPCSGTCHATGPHATERSGAELINASPKTMQN
jgi:hypothetical protein